MRTILVRGQINYIGSQIFKYESVLFHRGSFENYCIEGSKNLLYFNFIEKNTNTKKSIISTFLLWENGA
jgi:hypothetical protein